MDNEDTFLKITNRDLYDTMQGHFKAQEERLARIEQHVIQTNGKVKLAKWIATTSLSLVTSVILFLVAYKPG